MQRCVMKGFLGVAVTTIFLLAALPVSAQVLTQDDGRCAMGLGMAHVGHEWGHDFSGIKNDGSAWNPGALWGNKWDESQKNFPSVAAGGFSGQRTFAAVQASRAEDSYGLCTAYGDVFVSLFYAARAKFRPDSPGDYDPFTPARRREITAINIGTSFLLGGMASRIREDKEWLSSRSSSFDFNAEFYGK